MRDTCDVQRASTALSCVITTTRCVREKCVSIELTKLHLTRAHQTYFKLTGVLEVISTCLDNPSLF